MALSPRQVDAIARLVDRLIPDQQVAAIRNVAQTHTRDGRLRAEQLAGQVPEQARGGVEATEVAVPGADYDTLQELLDALLAAAALYVLRAGDTMTGDLVIQSSSGTALIIASGPTSAARSFRVDATAKAVILPNGTDLAIYSGDLTGLVAFIDGATGDTTVAGAVTAADLIATDDLFVGDDTNLGDDAADITLVWGHLKHKSAAPSIANGVAIGTGGSVATSIVYGTDQAGKLRITAGTTSLTTGVAATITFATARPNTSYAIWLTPATNAARVNAVQAGANNAGTTTWEVVWQVAPTAGLTYDYFYGIIEITN